MRAALVLGGAACVWKDAQAALDMGEYAGVVGCNHIGIYWPGRLDAWVSLHPDKFKPWLVKRAQRGLAPHRALFGCEETAHRFPGQDRTGSSGLFSLKVAFDELGFDRAVLCGVPLTSDQAHFNIREPWTSANVYRIGWTQALPHIQDRTRSMSGWTADLLGRPSPEFFA